MHSDNGGSRPGFEEIAFVGNHLPRKCGIATFTTDLCNAVSLALPGASCFTVAMNDHRDGYAYPEQVRFEIEAARREEYDLAADFLNVNQVDVVCVQHEYGIYGGRAGRFILPLLRQVRAPVVTTLHTVLTDPNPDQRQALVELADLSDRLVVMSPRAESYLRDIYGVPEEKIRMIHHGIPDMPFVDPNYYKDLFGAEGRRLLLTFGLLSPNKGIEYMIEAMPAVVDAYPDALYIVLGATHPHVKRGQGEAYRVRLQQRVRDLNLDQHVVFQNRFVELSELCEYLGAADMYVTPYLQAQQIVSGTLAYALGVGKAVVSTPYWYAEDMLSEERGRVVPFRDAEALAGAVLDLLGNEVERHAMRKRAYTLGRSMTWAETARRYIEVFDEARSERTTSPRPLWTIVQERTESLPDLNPRHLVTLTDSVGVLQHARFTVPDPNHGYCTDDQARALVVAVKAASLGLASVDWTSLASRYLSFILYAFDPETRRFGNFMNYRREWTKPVATEDVHGRAIWALAHVVAAPSNDGHRAIAMQLLDQSIPVTTTFSSPRGWAYVLLGIQMYLQRFAGASSYRREREQIAYMLLDLHRRNATDEWPWPEDALTYANARIPHALIEVGQWLPDGEMVREGLRMLDWLDRVQTQEDGRFVPVGSNGWYPRGGAKARFDQQPIEAYTMLDACIAAYRATHDKRWIESAHRAFDWFLGDNDLGTPVYDCVTGGCFDGLHPDRVNQNEGAESTIVWMLSILLMHEMQEDLNSAVPTARQEEVVQR
jgi:glycosyltransferase involved in cell wall biosynthesis